MTEIIHVLYVDDDPDLLKLGEIFLERSGNMTVTTARGAHEAIPLLRDQTFDVIISDYQMPQMDGIAFLKHLKHEGNTTPFILFTGKGREEVVIEALNNGATYYLQKGGDPKAQFALLDHMIQQAASHQRAEQSARSSGEDLRYVSSRYEVLIAASNTGAWEYHVDTGYGWCSPEYFTILGRDMHDIDTSGGQYFKLMWLDLLHPDDRDEATRHFEDYVQKPEGMYEQCFRMLHRDGHWVWILARGKTLPDSSGNQGPVIVGTHIDITVQKLTEQNLLRKNEELQAAYEEISATEEELHLNFDELTRQESILRLHEDRLIMAQEIGKTGCWEYSIKTNTIWGSAEGLRIFGFPPIAGNFPIDEIEACIPDRDRVHQALVDLLADGREYNLEYLIHPADGSGPKSIHSVARLEKDEHGNQLRVMGIIQDITEKKEVEKALYESDILLRGLFDTMPSGAAIYSVKNDGARGSDYIIADFNRASLLIEGKRKEEVVGRSLADLRPNIDEFGLIPIFQKVWKTGETVFYPAKIYVDEAYTNWYENYIFRLPTGQIVAI